MESCKRCISDIDDTNHNHTDNNNEYEYEYENGKNNNNNDNVIYNNELSSNANDEIQFRDYQPLINNKSLKNETHSSRKWVALTQHLPVDTVTKYVDVPVKETKIVYTPKVEYVEKIKEVPVSTIKNVNKVIEVPEVQFVDKIQYEPYVIEKLKYIPKEVLQYNVIKKPVIKNVITEKKVDVLHMKEHLKYKSYELVEEVYNHYDPEQKKMMDYDGNTINNSVGTPSSQLCDEYDKQFENPRFQYVDDNNTLPQILTPFGPQIQLPDQPTLEKAFIPKVEKVVEIQKKIDIPIDFPVPYIVPKPKIVDVKIPVFKFIDKYVPVPVRRKIIPKIKWTEKKYSVECVIEKPYLVFHDIIKIIPTDAKISIREYPKGVNKIDPSVLSEEDNLAIWMKVNADLKKEKEKAKEKEKENNLDKSSSSNCFCACSETEENDNSSYTDLNSSQDCIESTKYSDGHILDTLPLHPGHPLAMVHLQNKWIKEDTTKTQNLYDERFLEANRNAVFNLATNFPREAEVETSQIAAIQEQMAKMELNRKYFEASAN